MFSLCSHVANVSGIQWPWILHSNNIRDTPLTYAHYPCTHTSIVSVSGSVLNSFDFGSNRSSHQSMRIPRADNPRYNNILNGGAYNHYPGNNKRDDVGKWIKGMQRNGLGALFCRVSGTPSPDLACVERLGDTQQSTMCVRRCMCAIECGTGRWAQL